MITAYLSGPMESLPDLGLEWRKEYKKELAKIGIDCIIPEEWEGNVLNGVNISELKKTNIPLYKKKLREIIFHDLKLVREKSDFVIVKWDGEETSGTIHEVGYNFHELGRYNFLVTSLELANISGWFLSCFDKEFKTLGGLIEYLIDKEVVEMIRKNEWRF